MRRFTLLCLAALAYALLAVAPAAQAANKIVMIHTPPGKWINKGSLTSLDLVNGSLDTRVVVPDSYNKSKCMPVLYLLHGTGSDIHPGSTEWFNGGHVDQQANLPAITVVPGGGPSWWIDQWSNTARRPAWESWLWNTVMPAVNKKFNICPQRSQHTIAGLSMGGYGALYLAAQRPGYFGSAASFSGVISLHRPEWTPYERFKQLWGDPYGFYALTHDPTTLVPNLKNTRILVDAGNGDTVGNEALDPSKRLEELEFTAMSEDFVAHAKKAGINVTYQKHAGIHTWPNWVISFNNFLAWHPFKKVVTKPKKWTLFTSDQQGDAWGYSWKLKGYPGNTVKLSYANKTFKVEGTEPSWNKMTVVTPQGKTVKANLPFSLKGSKVKKLKPGKRPLLTTDKPVPVTVTATPAALTAGSATPITVSFKTTAALPASKVYEIGLTYTSGGCGQTVIQRVTQPAAGKTVTVTLTPPSDRPTWCKGAAVAGVLAVGKGTTGFALGDILGYKMVNVS